MKRKTLTIAISIFALIAIVSVGFASWVISRPPQYEDATGNITVETVSKSKTAELKVQNTELGAIHLGSPADFNDWSSSGKTITKLGAWLVDGTENNKTKTEVLYLKLTVVISGQFDTNNTLSFAISTNNENNYKYVTGQLIESGNDEAKEYIKPLKVVAKNSETGKIEYSKNEIKTINNSNFSTYFTKNTTEGSENYGKYVGEFYIITSWGSVFDSVNPYFYYNSQAWTETLENDSVNKLKHLNEDLLNGLSYTCKVTLSTVAS